MLLLLLPILSSARAQVNPGNSVAQPGPMQATGWWRGHSRSRGERAPRWGEARGDLLKGGGAAATCSAPVEPEPALAQAAFFLAALQQVPLPARAACSEIHVSGGVFQPPRFLLHVFKLYIDIDNGITCLLPR